MTECPPTTHPGLEVDPLNGFWFPKWTGKHLQIPGKLIYLTVWRIPSTNQIFLSYRTLNKSHAQWASKIMLRTFAPRKKIFLQLTFLQKRRSLFTLHMLNRLSDNYGNIVRNEPGCPDNDIPFPVCSTCEPSTRKIETQSSSKSPT